MSRVRQVSWIYFCDQTSRIGLKSCTTELAIAKGDQRPTGRSLVVHDQADADAAARQDGWTVGKTVLCPDHTGGAA